MIDPAAAHHEDLVFMMGEYIARFPADRMYAANHMWAQPLAEQPSVYRFGLTAYAVRLLQDVYFLDWIVEPPSELRHRQEIGAIESKKAESDLFAPLHGRLTAINRVALDDPSTINVSPYGDGWLIEIEPTPQALADLLSPVGYLQHLESAWQVAQRTIKGQVNSDD